MVLRTLILKRKKEKQVESSLSTVSGIVNLTNTYEDTRHTYVYKLLSILYMELCLKINVLVTLDCIISCYHVGFQT